MSPIDVSVVTDVEPANARSYRARPGCGFFLYFFRRRLARSCDNDSRGRRPRKLCIGRPLAAHCAFSDDYMGIRCVGRQLRWFAEITQDRWV